MPKDDTDWLTVEDIYEELGRRVPVDTIRSWIRSKRLPAYKPGSTYLVKREDLEIWRSFCGIRGRSLTINHNSEDLQWQMLRNPK